MNKTERNQYITLWVYNRVTGYWNTEKTITRVEDAQQWLALFMRDNPKEHYVLAKRRPKKIPKFLSYSRNLEPRT